MPRLATALRATGLGLAVAGGLFATALPLQADDRAPATTVRSGTLQLRQASDDGRHAVSATLVPRSGRSTDAAVGAFAVKSATVSGSAGCPAPPAQVFRDGFEDL